MKTLHGVPFVLALFASGLALADERPKDTAPADSSPAVTTEAIEADWLRQARLRYAPSGSGKIPPEEDAPGGNDGVKDGKDIGYYGFHTDQQMNPWWQVDLGSRMPLSRAVIYNGSTTADAKRALGLVVLVSDDGQAWTEVYRHDQSMFYGPKQPLEVDLGGREARYVRVQLPYKEYLHLDEIEVYQSGSDENVALQKPSTQSSTCKWSKREAPPGPAYPVGEIVRRGLKLAGDLRARGVDVSRHAEALGHVTQAFEALPADAPEDAVRRLYLDAQWAIRKMTLANPLLDFDSVLFVKRAPNLLLCHCDEYLSWWSRPGGELCILEGFKTDSPRLRSLTAGLLPPGDITRPDVSHDGKRVLFGYCRHYADLWKKENKLDKARIAEDAFYHLYEMNLDGTGLSRLTRGKYDDFDGRYLPDGRIVFLSTRRGRFVQCGTASAAATNATEDLPDSFVRCGGNAYRPVSIHTLHVMGAGGGNMHAISPFESFEWNPSVANDGRVLYARWDYVDRHRMWHMGLWSTLPDGTGARAVFGNFTQGPYSVFEARSIPGSQKIVFTASAHHSHAGGCLVLLDSRKGVDGPAPMTRLTPEVTFPEWEGWSDSYYANPYPLSEEHYLVTWSPVKLSRHAFNKDGSPVPGPIDSLGVYLFDAFGNLNLLCRDPQISSMCPIPIRPRRRPAAVASGVRWDGSRDGGSMLLQDVYHGDLAALPRGSVRRLRIVGVPPKTEPRMNHPNLGVTRDDPGKFVLGTVPIEEDGSAYFRVPSGVPLFFQALDAEGMAVQTMRSLTYVQPGQTYACVGCHDHRQTAPPARPPLAAMREPSKIELGPEGSWPLEFRTLVQPVLDKHCVECHKPDVDGEGAKTNLLASAAYQTLLDFGGERSLRTHVQARYDARRSVAGACPAMSSPVTQLLKEGHYEVALPPTDRQRLALWMDTYAQISGSYDAEQEEQLRQLRERFAALLTGR